MFFSFFRTYLVRENYLLFITFKSFNINIFKKNIIPDRGRRVEHPLRQAEEDS